jgi:hypothetical protein
MASSGERTLGDLVKERRKRVTLTCDKCSRISKYSLYGLIARHGIDKGLPDLLAELSADCPQRTGLGLELCGAVFGPDSR